jgi:nucleoside-diphosphate-sugar epimerase
MRTLITGHGGFIGRHLWRECVARGHELTGIDTATGPELGGGFEGGPLDCRTYFAHSKAEPYDLVLHCAATVGGRETIDGDPLAVASNLSVDADMFNWAMRGGAKRVVYFSSSAAYPVDMQMERGLSGTWRRLAEGVLKPSRETIGRPDQTYGWAKLTGEMLAEHVNATGLPVHVFRPFSGYGTDQSPDYPFRAFLDRALRRDDPFVIWGDGQQKRDFIHVDDIVGAVFAAIEHNVLGPVNLCTSAATSFTELAWLITQAAGYEPKFEYLPDKPVGVRYRVGHSAAMREFYEPTVSLQDGIRMALDAQVAA